MDVQPYDGPLVRRASPPSPLERTRLWNCPLLPHDERDMLADAVMPARAIAPNTELVRENACPDSVFLLVDGWAYRYATTREGGRQISALLVPGDICNLGSLMMERVDYAVRSATQATIAKLPRIQAQKLAAEYCGIANAFAWLTMYENVMLHQHMLSIGRRSAKARLAHILCELRVRLGADGEGACSYSFPLTQELLGDAMGLTSVHVNRMMQQLRAAGLIATADRIMTILDLPGLQRLAGFDCRYLHPEDAIAR